MPEKPSQAFARRMKRYRERRGWTQERLAEELKSIGSLVDDRAKVAKIETSVRGVSLDEAIAIAWALALPPPLLFLPLGEDDVEIEHVTIDAEGARRWVTGQAPAMDSNQYARLPGEWKADMVVWWLHDALHDASEAELRSQAAIRSAEYVGDQQRIEQAKRDHADKLLQLAEALEEIRGHDLLPPAIHEKTAEAMRRVGIEYKGPVYKPGEAEA